MATARSSIRTGADERAEAARRAVRQNPVWYHTLELAPDVATPGQIDLRSIAPKLLPRDLSGQRALDVGTFDGFWAFEMERRGADVVAIDIANQEAAQWPPLHRARHLRLSHELGVQLGLGFRLAAEVLNSQVRRVTCDVHDLTEAAIDGPVDMALIGALLLHLRDPVGGLERVREVLVPGARVVLLEVVSLRDTLLAPRTPKGRYEALHTPFNWWRPNAAALGCWLRTAGFIEVRRLGFHHPPQRRPMNEWLLGLSARRPV
jgi:SAM-dependent methyltransferase